MLRRVASTDAERGWGRREVTKRREAARRASQVQVRRVDPARLRAGENVKLTAPALLRARPATEPPAHEEGASPIVRR